MLLTVYRVCASSRACRCCKNVGKHIRKKEAGSDEELKNINIYFSAYYIL